MSCGRFLELLSARLDGALTGEEAQELEAHLAICPDCRAAGAQLAALQSGFAELEDSPAPEGFTQGVMDRIRAEEPKKVIPLFRRPQFKALAGLAACLALAVGLYGAARPQDGERYLMRTRGVDQTSQMEDEGGPRVNADLVDPEPADTPQIATYAAPEAIYGVTSGMQKAAPNPAADGIDGDWAYAEITLTLERMPEGGWELIPPDAFVSPAGVTVSVELLEQLEQLALEQGIGMSRVSGPEINDHCLIIILEEES